MNLVFAPSVYALIISGIALTVCLISDIRSRTIYPIVCFALFAAASFESGKDYANSVIIALLGFLPMLAAAKFGNGGGGDALLIAALGYTLPSLFSLYLYLFSSLFYLIVLIIAIRRTGDRKKQLPYVPFVFAAWVVLVLFFLTGVM